VTGLLDPQGPAAERIAGLWWLMFWLGLAVYVVVLALLVVPLLRGRRRAAADEGEEIAARTGNLLIWGGGVVVPVIILMVLVVASGTVGAQVPWNRDNPGNQLTIDVTGHMFWWQVHYPQAGFETANEIVIPAGEPVHLRMTSVDVIHSFWVPQLHGKIDLTPGHGTTITIEANRPGVYRGQCAEFCGLSHAWMLITVDAREREDFDQWLAEQAEPAAELTDGVLREGQQLFTSSSCVYCHTVRGHTAESHVGPDLTHFASRRTIGAGALPNTRGHLAGWIVDPQASKPGNRMPGTDLDGAELQLLLDYLESLR